MAESFEQVDQPPPRPGGFDGDGARRGKLGEERLESCGIVRHAMLGQLAVGGEDRDLRQAFVEVDAYVYDFPGLLSQSALAGSLSSQPIPGWAGGQRTYGITTRSLSLAVVPKANAA